MWVGYAASRIAGRSAMMPSRCLPCPTHKVFMQAHWWQAWWAVRLTLRRTYYAKLVGIFEFHGPRRAYTKISRPSPEKPMRSMKAKNMRAMMPQNDSMMSRPRRQTPYGGECRSGFWMHMRTSICISRDDAYDGAQDDRRGTTSRSRSKQVNI